MKGIKYLLSVSIIIFGFGFISIAQGKASNSNDLSVTSLRIKEIENKIPALMEKGLIPGISLSIIKNGKIFLTNTYGVKDTKTKQPVTKETVFEAASLSKPVFAYAVLKLVEKDLINLDKPLLEYVTSSYIQNTFSEHITKEKYFNLITPRMILSHNCGFPNWRQGNLKILFKPGNEFRYSGEGFVLLQRVVEHITNKKLNDLMKEMVFSPLNMTNSSYVWEEKFDKQKASAHKYLKSNGLQKGSEANAAASLLTNSSDYAKFILSIMNKNGLKEDTIKKMLNPQISLKNNASISWGLGVGIQKTKRGKAYFHWGDNGDFKAFFIAFPNEKSGMVYFANCFMGLSIVKDLVKISIDGEHPVFKSSIMSDYPQHDSPPVKLIHSYLNKGIDQVIKTINEKKGSPDFKELFSLKGLQRIGQELQSIGDNEAGLKISLLNLKYHPHSFETHKNLARSYLENKELDQAESFYQKALDLANKEKADIKSITWGISFIKGLKNPPKLSLDHLSKLAGIYGPRHIVLKKGSLYYFRENAATSDYKKLIPISRDTFIMEHLIYFRLRFDIPKDGAANKVTGVMEWGTEDISVRTPNKK